MRSYEETHPWITFSLDTGKLSTRTWLLLGQAQAKCEQIAGVPLVPEAADRLHTVYLVKGARATTAIEGNTLTEKQVREQLEGTLELPPSRQYQGQEVANILKALKEIAGPVLDDSVSNLLVEDILKYNATVLKGMPEETDGVAGRLRAPGENVRVENYLGAPGQDLGYLSNRLCEWLNNEFRSANPAMSFVLGVLHAIVAHVHIAWIHPFMNGNGRTARLLEFRLLLEAGVPTPASHLLSNHYHLTQPQYYRYLALSSAKDDGIYVFIDYALQGFVDGLDEQINEIEAQQLIVHWINFVYDRFRSERDTPVTTRRRQLILDLSKRSEPVPATEIRHVSPEMAEAYVDKTMKTIRRDLRHLGKMGLLTGDFAGFRPKYEILRAFLPDRRTN